jgi:predicted amidophosphoribosyltransferase
MLAGITSFALLTGIVSITLSEHLQKRSTCPSCSEAINKSANFCPHCGTDQRERPPISIEYQLKKDPVADAELSAG